MRQTIGQYEVLEILGQGGMGTVFKGKDPRFDREVAVKMLHTQLLRDPEVTERFKAEAIIQAKLSHPNVVTVYDFVSEPECLAMVMELVPGFALDTLIERTGGPLSIDWSLDVLRQVLSAMGFAHEQGLVHRDLKPSNVLVREIDGEPIAKVVDFGVAKILGSEKLRTATSAKMGTLCYMSPEQLRSPKAVDQRTDIYALGVMLYEMLSGRLPFEADTEFEAMRQTIEDPPTPLRVVNPKVPANVAAVIDRALAKDLESRFQSCQEFAAALLNVPVASLGSSSTVQTASGSRASGAPREFEKGTPGSPIIVEAVLLGSPAEKAGLRKGDQIVEVDGSPVDRVSFSHAIRKCAGRKVRLGILRGDRHEVVEVYPEKRIRGKVSIGIRLPRTDASGAVGSAPDLNQEFPQQGWFYSLGGHTGGPTSWAAVIEKTARSPQARVWRKGYDGWKLLSEVGPTPSDVGRDRRSTGEIFSFVARLLAGAIVFFWLVNALFS